MRGPTEMELRVAKSICLTGRRPNCYMDDNLGCFCGYFAERVESARAAIRAMYEPDDSMLTAYMAALEQPACPKKEPWHNAKMRRRWRAMIDAASPEGD